MLFFFGNLVTMKITDEFAEVISNMLVGVGVYSRGNLFWLFLEYDEVPIIIIGNLKSAVYHRPPCPVPVFGASDRDYEHVYLDISDRAKCKQVYDRIIAKCYENSTWEVEVWAIPPKRSATDNHLQKKRGLLSYLSFRKKPRSSQPSKMTRSARSLL